MVVVPTGWILWAGPLGGALSFLSALVGVDLSSPPGVGAGGNGVSGLELLEGPVIVLDHPAHGGNVGAVARAMSNTGLRHLRLVAPRQFPHPDAESFAAHAGHILEGARVFGSMDEAVADLNFLVATTNRPRGQRNVVLTPRQLGERLPGELAREGTRAGILFGPERAGLETTDVERCDVICNIPTRGNGSLNLAQAAMVVAYEVMMGEGVGQSMAFDPVAVGKRPAKEQMERFFQHLEGTLKGIDFIKPGRERHMMGSLRAIFHRAALDQREIAILRGILAEVEGVRRRDRQAWEAGRRGGVSEGED